MVSLKDCFLIAFRGNVEVVKVQINSIFFLGTSQNDKKVILKDMVKHTTFFRKVEIKIISLFGILL